MIPDSVHAAGGDVDERVLDGEEFVEGRTHEYLLDFPFVTRLQRYAGVSLVVSPHRPRRLAGIRADRTVKPV